MKKEIEIAVNWWADQLNKPPEQDNEGRQKIANEIHKTIEPVTDEQLENFKRELASMLYDLIDYSETEVTDKKRKVSTRCVGVDFYPDVILDTAAEMAGITRIGSRLPIKTFMWINPDEVVVCCGFRAPMEVLYRS